MKFEGIYTPVITPHREDGSHRSRRLCRAMIEHLIAAGVHGIINGGSTGEYYAQSMEERLDMATPCQGHHRRPRALDRRHRGDPAGGHPITMAEHAAKIGADAILVGSPPYSVPTERENALNALAIDRAADLADHAVQLPRPHGHQHGRGVPRPRRPQPQLLRHQGKLGRHQPRASSGARLPAYPDVLRHGRPGAGVLRLGRALLGLRRLELPARRASRALQACAVEGNFDQGPPHHVGADAA